jgi:hypothetical protein
LAVVTGAGVFGFIGLNKVDAFLFCKADVFVLVYFCV